MNQYIVLTKEVRQAIRENLPIVALESTIIAHGMPYPENYQTASEVEQIIRNHGAVPATIAILGGKIRIGLDADELEYLGRKGSEVKKTSKRDIPYCISQKQDGATTVSGTAFIASLAHIRIFATGGIGGVHRGAPTTFDISADLDELSKTSIAVVCAGAKSILDLGLTLEYLETKAVEVIGYRTDILPAFYTSKSDFSVNHRLDSPKEIADLLKTKWNLGYEGGVLIANPIPEAEEMDRKLIDQAISEAIREMEINQITGNKTTPYLLAKIKDLTKGASLKANIRLIKNNAALAAEIAKKLHEE